MPDSIDKHLDTLSEIVGLDSIITETETLSAYSVDTVIPKGVVFPNDIEQVSEIVRLAGKENLSIIPWGGGSKMSMGNPPKRLDIIVNTSKLNRITDIDAANLTVTLQAGVPFQNAQILLSSHENRCYLPVDTSGSESADIICSYRENMGCFLPFDPPYMDRTTIGGILAGNAGGPRRLLYGLPRDLALGIRFVAPNGKIIGAGGENGKKRIRIRHFETHDWFLRNTRNHL